MTINFTVSPSFPNERISDWYIFNTWLQRALSVPIHLELYNSFGAQRAAIAEGKVDLIYANPFDASLLVSAPIVLVLSGCRTAWLLVLHAAD